MKIYINSKSEDLVSLSATMPLSEFENCFVYCNHCGELILKSEAVEIDGKFYCPSCTFECSECGEVHPVFNCFYCYDSDARYCRDCYNHETSVCDDCGRHFRYEDSLTYCGDNAYCDSCYDRHNSVIADYHDFKDYGDIRFKGNEKRAESVYMGFELEVDSRQSLDREASAGWIKDRFDDFFHCENDGSLYNGFEIISQPASLNYHLEQMNDYTEMFRGLLTDGWRSNDVKTCGFHIHLDRYYFGPKGDSAIAKLLYIFEKFQEPLRVFSRRSVDQANDWARSRKEQMSENGAWIKKAIKDSKNWPSHSDRYFAVNLTNSDTIEIRLWRGTLNPNTFEATLRFTARIAEICKNTRAVEVAAMSFDDLLGDDPIIRSYWDRISNRVGGAE